MQKMQKMQVMQVMQKWIGKTKQCSDVEELRLVIVKSACLRFGHCSFVF